MPSLSQSDPSSARLCVIGEADPFLAQLLRRFGEKCGLRIRRAQTGEALLNLVEQDRPALVILDPDLPGKLRGREAYQRLKSQSHTAHLPLIACTWMKETEARAALGQDLVYLQKPDLHFEDFRAALEQAGIQIAPDLPGTPG